MKIKIVKCSNKEWWYNSLVGKVLTATIKKGQCVATYYKKDQYNNFYITGIIEEGDYANSSFDN